MTVTQITSISLSYIIPVYNEEEIIKETLNQFDEQLRSLKGIISDYEIIIVDDASTDNTASIIESCLKHQEKLKLIRHSTNQGVGEAIQTGLKSSTMDWFSVNCADQPFQVSDIRKFSNLFGQVDLVVVCRLDRSANNLYRKITSWVNCKLIQILFWNFIPDFQFAQFYRRSLFEGMNIISRGTLVPPEMIMRFKKKGARIATVSLPFHPRLGGKSKYGHPKHFMQTLKEMIRLRFSFYKADI